MQVVFGYVILCFHTVLLFPQHRAFRCDHKGGFYCGGGKMHYQEQLVLDLYRQITDPVERATIIDYLRVRAAANVRAKPHLTVVVSRPSTPPLWKDVG